MRIERGPHQIRFFGLGVVVVLAAQVLGGCSTSGSASVGPPAKSNGPEIVYGASPAPNGSVTYQPGVVLVQDGAGSVRSVSADGMVWTIKGSTNHIGDLTPGKVMVATGIGVGRILAVSQVAGDRRVVLGPVDITDVVRDGIFDSTTPVSLDSALAYDTPSRPGLLSSTDDAPEPMPSTPTATPGSVETPLSVGGIGDPSQTATSPSSEPPTTPGAQPSDFFRSSPRRRAEPGAAGPGVVTLPTIEFSSPARRPAALRRRTPVVDDEQALVNSPTPPGSGLLPAPVSVPAADAVGAYHLTPFCCSGGTGVRLSYDHGGMRLSATITLHLATPSLTFRLHIAAGKVTEAGIELRGAAGIGIQFSAASTVGVKGNVARQPVQVPVAFTVPLAGFGLPLTARIEQTFSLSTAFASPGSISASGDYSFGGTLGFGIHGLTQTVTKVDDFATETSLLDSIQAVGIAPVGLFFGYQAKLTVGVGLLGFSAGAWLSLITRIGVTAAASEAAIPCRLAAINVGLGYGIGYQIPAPVAKLVNIFLTTFGAPPIQATGGITGPYESIVNKSATLPAGSSCQ